MEYCQVCGGKLGKAMQYCPHCGKSIPGREEEKPRDYWAERLEKGQMELEPEEEEWLQDVDEDQLQDLNEPEGEDFWEKKQQEKKKKRNTLLGMAGFFLLVMAILAGVWTANRSRVDKTVPGSGIYYGQYCSSREITVSSEKDRVELLGDGFARVELLGRYHNGNWTLQEDQLEIQSDADLLKGTLKDGVLTIHFQNYTYVLAREGVYVPRPQQSEISEEEAQKPSYDHWMGDYYGFLVISQCTGKWENQEAAAMDICCQILVEEDAGTIRLWSSDNKPGEMLAQGDVLFLPGSTGKGKMQLEWGMFQNEELGPGAWVVDPGKSPVSHIADMFCIQGRFSDVSDGDSGFAYSVFLRPWGMDWADVAAMDSQNLPLAWMLPPGYESWYLPAIRSGHAMPQSF